MTRRAWVLVVLGILIPGSPQLIAGSRRLGRFAVTATFVLWALAVVALLLFSFNRIAFVTIATNSFFLYLVQAAIIFYGVLWILLGFDTLRLVRLVNVGQGARVFVAAFVALSLVFIGGAGAYGLMITGTTRSTVSQVFGGGSTIAAPVNGRYNILLLGGDAGPDRTGLRPDSISLVSIDAATGKATIIGIPRNLENVPFPASSPMAAAYPNGYGANGCQVDVCLINSIYTEVQTVSPQLYPKAVAQGSQPGIEGMRDAVQGVTGIRAQYYVLIDMQGFSDLIDALGGVTIDSTGRYPINGDVDSNGQPVGMDGWIEPGVQVMNGYTALWYARSRYGTSDYDRMQRQREVQTAVLQQFDPATVLTKFQAIATAGTQVVKTDMPQGMLGYFVDLAGKARGQAVATLELVPPLIDTSNPDFGYIQGLVSDALTSPSASPTPSG